MGTVILIISAFLFISTFGIHAAITSENKWEQPLYVNNPLLSSIPWISGFLLAVIPLSIVFELNYIAVFFINLVLVWILGPMLTKAFLVRFASGKGLGNDMLVSFIAGLVSLIIGLLINSNQ